MASNISTQKRIRQNEKRRLRNKSYRTKVFTYFKKVKSALDAGKNKEDIYNAFRDWQKILDKTTAKGIIHKNTTARRKSRMMKKIKAHLNTENK